MNKAIFKSMIDFYNEQSFTHNYIFGFEYKGNIYYTFSTSETLPLILILDKASRGAGYSIRFKPNLDVKKMLLPNAHLLCSKKFFDETVASNKYNAGENFEKLVTEMFGQKWEKDNVPFWKDGDLTIEEIAYQIKFQKATFISEKQIQKMRSI
jgi:hypothetical protein